MTDLPHRTTLSGSTLDHRRPLELGDRLTLLVDAVVTGIGVKRVSDGDIEVRTLRTLDILEADDADQAVAAAMTTARKARQAEADDRAGALTLDLDTVDFWLVSFETCGHDANYPEDWLRVEETGTEAVSAYFRDLERPTPDTMAPCPRCYLDDDTLEAGAVSKVALVARSEAFEPSTGRPVADVELPDGPITLGEIGDVDDFIIEHLPGYVDMDPDELCQAFDELPALGLGAWQEIERYETEVFGDDQPRERDEVRADLAARIARFSEEAPWDGYDAQSATVVRDRLKTHAHRAREVHAYEEAHKARKSILGAAQDIFAPPPPIVDEAPTTAEEERF